MPNEACNLLLACLRVLRPAAFVGSIGDPMGKKRPSFNFENLTVAERIQLAEDLWDSIEPESPEITITPTQAVELDTRLEQLRRGPDSGESWEIVRDRLQDCLRRQE